MTAYGYIQGLKCIEIAIVSINISQNAPTLIFFCICSLLNKNISKRKTKEKNILHATVAQTQLQTTLLNHEYSYTVSQTM